ncbi:MAG: methylated-DNA--[protein]-cysteine S-methyltransferase [Rhodospirillales bacterium]|nr:methylated-DNA--[protein]-cysteine S-methyltransferase [Rhodospirillales bacterium]MCB9995179.1 methylated-DNA--[protein]-cysteine S-methyltransferase [Rhodospirillales bacterium]
MDFTDQIIAESIDYLVAHYTAQPDLHFLAQRAGYEPTHFQKLFKDKVGISPKRLVQYMNMRYARELLASGMPLLDAAHETGLSGTGRLHDLFVSCEAVTPGDVRHKGRGVTIFYGYHPTPLGEVMVGQTPRGVCYLGFLVDGNRNVPFQKMAGHFPEAAFKEDFQETKQAADSIVKIWCGQGDAARTLALDVHGTNLQIQVWKALLQIPLGQTRTYQQIAQQVGRPKAARAVGNAVGANPVSLLIPCHRVIRATGIIDNYGWGSPRKKLILGMEDRLLAADC